MKIPSKENVKFVLLGHGFHLCTYARMLKERGFPSPVIVTHPRVQHERDRQLLTNPRVYAYVFDVARELDIEIIESSSVNKAPLISKLLEKGCNHAFSFSCRSIIKKEFIDSFKGKVFNIHPSMLPKERGGGTFSWRIMNDINKTSATIHQIDEGIDTGPIIYQKEYLLEKKRPKPIDYLMKTNEIYTELISTFLDAIEKRHDLVFKSQNENDSTYLPRLHSETNAAIDWRWSVTEIERFVRAFSDPYPGAFTFLNGQKIIILDADYELSEERLHPYMIGRVLTINQKGEVQIIARGGFLIIKTVQINNIRKKAADAVKYSDVLYTPMETLFAARTKLVKISEMLNVK